MQCAYCSKNKDNLIYCIEDNLSVLLCKDCHENLKVRWDEYVADPLENGRIDSHK
jgi:hypothetical protein